MPLTNPLRADPTRTTSIRKAFQGEVNKRFRELRGALREWLVERDELDLKQDRPGRLERIDNQGPFRQDADKISAFRQWFSSEMEGTVLGPDADAPWTTEYIDSAYRRGQVNSFIEARKKDLAADATDLDMSQAEFLRESFAQPETLSKVQMLATRAFEDLRGVTATMGSEMNRILAQGIADGIGVDQLARDMNARIRTLTRTRALTIARTETIRAHAEGQLDAFDRLGVQELGVRAEWSTAGDDRVCPDCHAMEGQVFTVKEARNLIPFHPNCRCAWIPSRETRETATKKTAKGEKADRSQRIQKIVNDDTVPWGPEKKKAIWDVLEEGRPGEEFEGKIFRSKNPPAAIASRQEQADRWLRKIVPEKVLKRKMVTMKPIGRGSDQRSYYHSSKRLVMLGEHSGGTGPSVIIHEMGHHFDHTDKRLNTRAVNFLRSRAVRDAQGNPRINTAINGMSGEMGYVTDFKSKGGSDYSGKVTGSTESMLKSIDNTYGQKRTFEDPLGVEVTSMGLQRMYDDPAGFFVQDREYFDFIVDNVLR